MGHRLSKIATRTGDDGTTGLANGSRIEKTTHASRQWAMSMNSIAASDSY